MSYKPRSFFSLVQDINSSIYLPHIQRPFVWDEEQILGLFDSLMRNYPFQTFLFWRTKDEIKARKFMGTIEWDAPLSEFYDRVISQKDKEKVFVLDGQQRIQSLYAIFKGGIKSQDGKDDLNAYFDVTSGHTKNKDGIMYTLQFLKDEPNVALYKVSSLLGKDEKVNAEDISDSINDQLNGLLKESDDERKTRERLVRRNISQLVSLLRTDVYFWIEELDGIANDYPYSKVLDIFVRVNSGGTKLDAADLMFAAMKEEWSEIEENVEDVVDLLNANNLSFDKSVILKSIVLVQGKGAELTPEKFTSDEGTKLLNQIKTDWGRLEQTFYNLRDFISSNLKLYGNKVVRSYNSFIPLFDYFYNNPKPTPKDYNLMMGYYYKSQLFNWYSAQTDVIINGLHSIVGKKLGQFPLNEIKAYFKLRNYKVELLIDHLNDNRLRYIILNLIYVENFGSSPFNVRYKDNEPHIDHIYPKTPLKNKLSLSTDLVNIISNYRFVGAAENLRKRAELPAPYFNRLLQDGVDIKKHLLVDNYSSNPSNLLFDITTYEDFKIKRLEEIFKLANKIVNPEL